MYGPFTKMSSSYDVVNFKTINYEIGKEPPFDAVIHFASYLYTFIFIYSYLEIDLISIYLIIYLSIHLETWYPVGVHPGVVRHQREAAERGDRQVKTEPGRTICLSSCRSDFVLSYRVENFEYILHQYMKARDG